MDSDFEQSEDSEEEVFGYDRHLPETRDSDYEQSDDDIEAGDEVEMSFNDLSKKYGMQSIDKEVGTSSMDNSSNDENGKKAHIDYRRKNLLILKLL